MEIIKGGTLQLELLPGQRSDDKIERVARALTAEEIRRLAKTAASAGDVRLLAILAERDKYAACQGISLAVHGWRQLVTQLKRDDHGADVPNLFCLLEGMAPAQYKKILRRLARQTVVRHARSLTGKGLRGTVPRPAPYQPGMPEFDLAATIENYLPKGYLTHVDVVGVTRRRKKKTGVLLLDASGSVSGQARVVAALTTAVMAHHMRDDPYAIVLFDYHAHLLKGIDQPRSHEWIVDRLLQYRASGCTDIAAALELGLQELGKVPDRDKFGILITDGCWNRGAHPARVAEKYPALHVIAVPTEYGAHDHGAATCRQIAERGRAKCVLVRSYREIPRVLSNLLRRY